MNYLEVSPYGIVGKDFEVLTYSSTESVPVGSIAEIPVGKKKFVGVVLRQVPKPKFECKEILRTLADKPLPLGLLKLHTWLSAFYATHPSTTWQTMLPSGLNRSRRFQAPSSSGLTRGPKSNFVEYTKDQQSAITKILKNKSGTALLHGITGSGKTEVYKALAKEAATRGLSTIILVPEISLTAQLVGEFQRDFSNVIVTHSKQTEAQRHLAWLEALNATEPTVVVGPRSALFMPLADLGLIVIDECHEPSYKQEKAPRYSALRAASVLANTTSSRLVLGSATPLIADYYTAEKLDRPIIKMQQLARAKAKASTVEIVDLTARDARAKNPIFTPTLLSAIAEALEQKKQVLLFHNRRGTAPITLCENCGYTAMCPRCFVPLALHADKHQLRCHICGHVERPATTCPACYEAGIIHKGIGTKMIESEVAKLFPDAKVRRFDGDNARGEGVHALFAELKSGECDIIIGTQTIAKGLDLPNLKLVGIVQADAGLMLPDFSSGERTFQLIAQACGRVGRDEKDTRVIIQTYQPQHPAVTFGAKQNYDEFYKYEIFNRSKGHFPPFTHLLKLTNSYKTEAGAINSAKKLAKEISSLNKKVIQLGPTPAFYERQRDSYRWQITVRAKSRAELLQIAAAIPLQHWAVELDPTSLI